MARFISHGYDCSGYSEGDIRAVSWSEYQSIPGASSDNVFYFVYDRGELRYNTYVLNPYNGPSAVTCRVLSLAEYNALTPAEKSQPVLYLLSDREVILYQGRVFGDISITDEGTQKYIFYQWKQWVTTMSSNYTSLEARVAALEASVSAITPALVTKSELQDMIAHETYVPGKAYIITD